MKVRHNLYIDRETSDTLDAPVADNRGNKSRLVMDVRKTWVARRAAVEVDGVLEGRLGLMSHDSPHPSRGIEILLEKLFLFVRNQLGVTRPSSDNHPAAIVMARDRSKRFVTQIGRQIASGAPTPGKGTRS